MKYRLRTGLPDVVVQGKERFLHHGSQLPRGGPAKQSVLAFVSLAPRFLRRLALLVGSVGFLASFEGCGGR